MALIGILSSYYFFAAWYFLTGNWGNYQFPYFTVNLPKFNETAWAYAALIFVIFTIVTGMVFIQNNMRRLLVQSRKSWSLIYLYLLVAILIPFLSTTHHFDYWILAAVPVAAFAAGAFLFPERKWFAVFIHWSLVALTVISGYFVK